MPLLCSVRELSLNEIAIPYGLNDLTGVFIDKLILSL